VYNVYRLNIRTGIVAMVHRPLKPLLHPTLDAYPGLTPAVSLTPPPSYQNLYRVYKFNQANFLKIPEGILRKIQDMFALHWPPMLPM